MSKPLCLVFMPLCLVFVSGLLEGAHEGRGLGHEFLRHCQRARMLVHVIDGSSTDPLGDFFAIQAELQLFNQDLSDKPQVGCSEPRPVSASPALTLAAAQQPLSSCNEDTLMCSLWIASITRNRLHEQHSTVHDCLS